MYVEIEGVNRPVDIDKEIAPIIKILNKKGYRTCGCCQGHYNEYYGGYFDTYIYFIDELPKDAYPPLYDPKNKKKTKYSSIRLDNKFFSWFGTIKATREEQDEEHKKLINDLTIWTEGLKDKI